jgi:hypothetical protein
VTFNNTAWAKLALQLGESTTAGTSYDQLRCQGAVTLGALSELEILPTGAFNPAAGETFVLLDKTSAGDISGTFSNAAEGAVRDVNGKKLQLTYAGGTGNDLVAMAVTNNPIISEVADITINEDETTGPRKFTVGDADTNLGDLVVTASSNNTALVPNGSIVLTGSGVNRTVAVTPVANGNGSAVITLTVDDGTTSASSDFLLTVTPVYDPASASNLSSPVVYTENTSLNLTNIVVGGDPDSRESCRRCVEHGDFRVSYFNL